jgi:ribosomal protein S18 acetylase RimI-like enzyme
MASVSIEEVTDLDAAWPELVALFQAFEEYNADFLSRDLRGDWEARWKDHLALGPDRLILVAYEGSDAMAYLVAGVSRDHGLFNETYAFISDAFVRSDFRGRGLGRRLLRTSPGRLLR